MKLLTLLALSLIVTSCAKPANPTDSPYPLYGSLTTIVGGIETACDSCAILEVNGNALRVTFSNNGVDECSGEGTLSYLSDTNLDFPANIGETINWTGNIVGDNSSKNVFCFPDLLELDIEKTDTNKFSIDYNGKLITVRKIN
jgi:hypothetical protein